MRNRIALCLTVAALGALGALGAPAAAQTAADQLRASQAALRDDAKRTDWRQALVDAQAQRAFLNDAPASRLEVARAQLRLGDTDGALAQARAFVALGDIHPVLAGDLFAPLKPALQSGIDANQTQAGIGRTLIPLPGAALPEDIDRDPVSRRFFISEVLGRAIVSVAPDGVVRPFAANPDDWPVAALKIDARRRRLWVTQVAFDGFAAAPREAWGRSAVLAYDLESGRRIGRYEAPGKTSLADMALTPQGEPILSDGEGGGLYRLRNGRFTRLDHGEFISPQTPAFCGDPNIAFVPDYVRGLARFDLTTGQVSWFSGRAHALDGIDGLYCRARTLFAIRNGGAPMRVMAFQLNRAGTEVVGERILDRSRPGLGDPTHGVLAGRTFFYLSNVGWPALDEHGVYAGGPPAAPPALMGADVGPMPAPHRADHARPRAASRSAS